MPLVLLVGWLLADALQPSSYSPMRQTVSVAAGYGGRDRWVMTAALLSMGGCYLALAKGLVPLRRVARAGLLVAGVSAIAIALCPEPAVGTTALHAAWTSVGAFAIAIWPALVTMSSTGRPVPSAWARVVVTGVFVALLGWLVVQTRNGSMLGLAERMSSNVQVCWPLVVTRSLRRDDG